jgi:hypothetical protein
MEGRSMNLSKAQLIKFHILLGKALGVKFVGDPGFIQRLWQRLLERIFAKYASFVPDSVFELKPMTFKNIIYLPYVPGITNEVSPQEQVLTAVHEGTHALRIRTFPGRTSQWYGLYFTDEKFRALQEASAQQAANEVLYYWTGDTRELDLDAYLIMSSSTMELVARDYNRQSKQMQRLGRGEAGHVAAIEAIKILRGI